jgi:hypothetical protein
MGPEAAAPCPACPSDLALRKKDYLRESRMLETKPELRVVEQEG